jgi:hypothetical protein
MYSIYDLKNKSCKQDKYQMAMASKETQNQLFISERNLG